MDIVAAGQSASGMEFSAEHADYNFILGSGVNTPTAISGNVSKLREIAADSGRDVGALPLFMVIAAETDEVARAKWEDYHDNADVKALAWMAAQSSSDQNSGEGATSKTISLPEGAVNLNMGTLVGSYRTIAAMLDEVAAIAGTKGIMLVFDDFLEGVENFGTRIQPLMESRRKRGGTSS